MMMPLFADIFEGVPGEQVKNFFIILAGLALMIERCLAIRRHFHPHTTVTVSGIPDAPQPFVVKHAEEHVSRSEFHDIKVRVDDLPAMERRLDDADERRAEAIHVRLNPLSEAIKAVQAEQKTMINIMKSVLRQKAP